MHTYGWDIISICNAKTINERLEKQPAASLHYEDGTHSIMAKLGAWQIVAGGSTKLIHCKIPISAGTLTSGGRSRDLSGVEAILELQLAFIRNAESPESPESKDLRFNLLRPGAGAGDETEGAVSLVSVHAPALDRTDRRIMADALVQALIANREHLNFIFARVSQAATLPAASVRHTRYMYAEGKDGTLGSLAVLGLLSNRDPSHLPSSIDPAIIPANSPLSVTIAPALFLEHVLKPALPAIFGKTTSATQFCMVKDRIADSSRPLNELLKQAIDEHPDGDLIVNSKVIHLPEVSSPVGKASAILTSVVIQVVDSSIRIECQGKVMIPALIDSYIKFHVVRNLPIECSSGRLTLHPDPDPKPVATETRVSPVIDFLAALFGIASGGILGGALAITLANLLKSVTKDLGDHGKFDMHPVFEASTNLDAIISKTIHWPDLEGGPNWNAWWGISHASLADAFCAAVERYTEAYGPGGVEKSRRDYEAVQELRERGITPIW